MPNRDFLPDVVPKSGNKPLVVMFPGLLLEVKNVLHHFSPVVSCYSCVSLSRSPQFLLVVHG
jgi:hypothetical protein